MLLINLIQNTFLICLRSQTFACLFITAPGSYDVEKSEKTVTQSSSAYSFGIKYKEQKVDNIPGKILCVYIIFPVAYIFHYTLCYIFF